MNTSNYELDHEAKQITTCAWCFPGDAVLEAFPELAPVSYYGISHGICPSCKAKQLAQIAARRREITLRRLAEARATLVGTGAAL